MRRYKLLFLVAAVLLGFPAFAQSSFSVTPYMGYGNFNMKDLKLLQQSFIYQNDGLGLKVTDEFPAYYQYGLRLGNRLNTDFTTGVILEIGSTGGRVDYKDYSGSIRSDQLVSYKAAGLFAEYTFYHQRFTFSVGNEINVLHSALTIESAFHLQQQPQQTEKDDFVALGYSIKPYVSLQYPVKRFAPTISLGYLIYDGQPFHLRGNKDMVLAVGNKGARPQWSGVRLTAGLGYFLF